MEEIWKEIPGYECLYQVSNKGRVRGLVRNKILKQSKLTGGYLNVWLSKGGKVKIKRVHRLVALAFLPNPQNKEYVNHIDKDVTNNNVDNLEWVTQSENQKHSYMVGRNINTHAAHEKKCKRINVYRNGELVMRFNSAKECASALNLNYKVLIDSICQKWNQYKGFRFEYETH